MILRGALAEKAWAYYAEQVRRDPTNLYCCSRLLDHGYRLADVEDGEALLRAATLTVFRSDPFALAATMPSFQWNLSEEDLEEMAGGLDSAGLDEDTTNFLRGRLWLDAARGRSDQEPFARRARDYLDRVSPETVAREPEHARALAECLRIVDYPAFRELMSGELSTRKTDLDGRDLFLGLGTAAKHEDWDTYSRWREHWDALPRNAHVCECYVNSVFTWDGLRALERGDLAAIPDLMRRATDVRGCPHLTSGGARLSLVDALTKRGALLDDAASYLDACERFYPDDDRLAKRRAKIAAARKATTS